MSKIQSDSQVNKPEDKARYKIKNWSVYNNALVNRGNISLYIDEQVLEGWYDDSPAQRGGQYVYSDLCICLFRINSPTHFGANSPTWEGVEEGK